jgi:hypothetical protein
LDREPLVPAKGVGPEEVPDAELLAAVESASRHVGAAAGRDQAGPVVRFDAARAGARRVWALGGGLALSVALAAALTLIPPRAQSPDEVEADLRWAVDNVVREVEAARARTGSLPAPQRLGALLGEHLTYEPAGDAYVITGERDGVRVRWDSRDAARPPQDGA